MTPLSAVGKGREAFERQAWGEAHAQLLAADGDNTLDAEDLERLAWAAELTGKYSDAERFLAKAHNEYLERGNVESAVRCAFWLGLSLTNKGEFARGGGWLGRAETLLEGINEECVERGYILLPQALRHLDEGRPSQAFEAFDQARKIAERFHDRDLLVLSSLGRGCALLRLGNISAGLVLLDDAMLSVTEGEVSPIVIGIVYCAAINACQEIFDLRRSHEWTAALQHWCDSHPDLVPFRGECLLHRAEVLQMQGDWQAASNEAQRACLLVSEPLAQPVAGSAFYQQAELYRLRGEFASAEDAYRQASRLGRRPEPGRALLRLSQGQAEAAEANIRRALDEDADRSTRCRLLAAYIEIALQSGKIEAARSATEDLARIASDFDAPFLNALSSHANGAVLFAEGDILGALAALRRASTIWQEVSAPYEAARTRILIGLACRELGDEDAAEMEFDAARWAFQQLGASPDLRRVDALTRRGGVGSEGLTPREIDVLRQLAAGRTNRAIAEELFISEKTVARHVSNIFLKLGISSRSAATAYAYEHGILSRPT